VVFSNEHCLVIAPYAPRFPFETWIVPRMHESHYENAHQPIVTSVASALRTTLRMFDTVLERPSYNMVVHTAPVQSPSMAHYHWHIEIMPRINRAAGAGFEWGTSFHVNPVSPEESAEFLRNAAIA
jgi:UDPglucose--hexose-1-phosphate uridylyltransferase